MTDKNTSSIRFFEQPKSTDNREGEETKPFGLNFAKDSKIDLSKQSPLTSGGTPTPKGDSTIDEGMDF